MVKSIKITYLFFLMNFLREREREREREMPNFEYMHQILIDVQKITCGYRFYNRIFLVEKLCFKPNFHVSYLFTCLHIVRSILAY